MKITSKTLIYRSLLVKTFVLCALFFYAKSASAQSVVYLISSHDQTAETMHIDVNGGVDGSIEMKSPFHEAKLMGYLNYYQKMIRKCTFKETGQIVLSYGVEFGSGKKIHQELTLNLKDGETYYVNVWGKKWSMKEITKKDYDKLTKKISEFHICPDWSSN